MKVIVQGYFQDNSKTNLYIIDYDFESKKYKYSTESYLEVLNIEVELVYEALSPGYTFIQDNASIHTIKKVKKWFADRGILYITDWPPYSLDLNLIEYIQQELKKRVFEMFLEIMKDKSESEYTRQQLESVL